MYKKRKKQFEFGLSYEHQRSFVRQSLDAKRDGRRISARIPLVLEKYLEKEKNVSDLVIELLATRYAKTRTAYSDLTVEELQEQISDL